MAYLLTTPRIGTQPIAETSTTQNHPAGTVVHAVDPTYGEGQFIYLKGVASTVVGTPVVCNNTTLGQTALAPVGSNKPQNIFVAMSANVASQWGWYQISGRAVGAKTSGLALAANAAVGILTAGKFAATGSGKEVSGAVTVAASTTSTTVVLQLDRPRMQGRVT